MHTILFLLMNCVPDWMVICPLALELTSGPSVSQLNDSLFAISCLYFSSVQESISMTSKNACSRYWQICVSVGRRHHCVLFNRCIKQVLPLFIGLKRFMSQKYLFYWRSCKIMQWFFRESSFNLLVRAIKFRPSFFKKDNP